MNIDFIQLSSGHFSAQFFSVKAALLKVGYFGCILPLVMCASVAEQFLKVCILIEFLLPKIKTLLHIDVFGLLRETREMRQGDQEDANL